jgi:hypothetical protein
MRVVGKSIGNRIAVFEAIARGEKDADIATALAISKQAVWKKRPERGEKERVRYAAWLASTITNPVNASLVDPSTVASHESDRFPHATHPAAMPPGERKEDRSLDPTPTRALTWVEKTARVVEGIEVGGLSRTGAYKYADIPPSSARQRFERDESFRNAILEAEGKLERGPAQNLKRLAEGNGPQAHIAAAIFLSRRFPAEWAERRNVNVDVSGRIETFNIQAILANATIEDVAAISAHEALLEELENRARRQLPAHNDAIDGEIVSETRPELL